MKQLIDHLLISILIYLMIKLCGLEIFIAASLGYVLTHFRVAIRRDEDGKDI